MDYNTTRTKLILPEYGRNIQKMVEHARTIKDKDERNRVARSIITIMGNMNPHLRDINDFKHKLWDHLAIMSELELDIDSPYPTPTQESLNEPPDSVPYNNHHIKYRHYGKIVEMLINEAIGMKNKEERNALLQVVANHMRKSQQTWNKENHNDESVYHAIETMSRGKLKAMELSSLLDVRDGNGSTKNNKRKKVKHK